MAKDPAFLFYPGDWLGGTLTFNRSHKGAYMDLLMAQFNNGHMSIEDIQTVLGSDFETMWEQKLKSKFKKDHEGCYFNEKMENEIIKRKRFTDSRKKNLAHTEAHKGAHMNSHMENENENENIKEDETEKPAKKTAKRFTPPTFEEVQEYCNSRDLVIDIEYFLEFYGKKNWMVGKNKMTNWKLAVNQAKDWERNQILQEKARETDKLVYAAFDRFCTIREQNPGKYTDDFILDRMRKQSYADRPGIIDLLKARLKELDAEKQVV